MQRLRRSYHFLDNGKETLTWSFVISYITYNNSNINSNSNIKDRKMNFTCNISPFFLLFIYIKNFCKLWQITYYVEYATFKMFALSKNYCLQGNLNTSKVLWSHVLNIRAQRTKDVFHQNYFQNIFKTASLMFLQNFYSWISFKRIKKQINKYLRTQKQLFSFFFFYFLLCISKL